MWSPPTPITRLIRSPLSSGGPAGGSSGEPAAWEAASGDQAAPDPNSAEPNSAGPDPAEPNSPGPDPADPTPEAAPTPQSRAACSCPACSGRGTTASPRRI